MNIVRKILLIMIIVLLFVAGYLWRRLIVLEVDLIIIKKEKIKHQLQIEKYKQQQIFLNREKRTKTVQKNNNQIVLDYEKFKQKTDTITVTDEFRINFITKLENEARKLQGFSK